MKGRVPFYNRAGLREVQEHMDELQAQGVLARPEDPGVVVEQVSPVSWSTSRAVASAS